MKGSRIHCEYDVFVQIKCMYLIEEEVVAAINCFVVWGTGVIMVGSRCTSIHTSHTQDSADCVCCSRVKVSPLPPYCTTPTQEVK
jgi:hypothetical protein